MALVHPSQFQPEDADAMDVPVALMPSGGENREVMDAFWERIQQKLSKEKCVRRDFVSVMGLFFWCGDGADEMLAGL